MKYYLYISAPKVEMLFPQIPPAFLQGVSTELKVNLGVLSTTLKGAPPERLDSLPSQVAAISKYLQAQSQVGTVDAPLAYIAGIYPMRYGVVAEYASDIAFFGAKVDRIRCALVGSSDSVVGSPQRSGANHAPYYYTLKFLNYLAEGSETERGQLPYCTYKEAYDIAMKALVGPPQRLTFLAKTLHTEKNLVFATPIFVALDE